MHLELNLKMLMTKMGVTPTESQAQRDQKKDGEKSQIPSLDCNREGTPCDLDGDFEMTADEFDGVMENCSRERNMRDHREPPPRKAAKTVITPQSQTGSNDE